MQITTESQGHWSSPDWPTAPTVPPATVRSLRELHAQQPWRGLADEQDGHRDVGPSNQSHFETICTSDSSAPRRSAVKRDRGVVAKFIFKLQHLDPVKLAYLRTSFVFAISVLVTWTPSSINRVYSIVYPDRMSFGLNVASAAVLPLQGVWNAVIFFTTSWNTLREEASYIKERRLARHLENGCVTRLDGGSIEALRGHQRDRFERARFERAQAVRGDQANELNAIGRVGTVGTVRVMHGLFSEF